MSGRRNRREFFQTTAAAAMLSAAGRSGAAAPGKAAKSTNIYMEKLNVRPVINGVGTVTILGGSIMPPDVVQAMVEASRHFVPMEELQQKVGDRIAELLKVPAAMISCGAASAITVATAACVAGGDRRKLQKLPDTTGLRNEVILQKTHRSGYEAQIELTGARLVWVETREELERAIGERTAMLFFLNKEDPKGKIKRSEWVQVGKARGVPTFMDAAADVPPPQRLSQYVQDGFDLVTFSGGKGMMGPQGTGLLLGRKDLVETARYAISPHGGIGRGMKVGKEELMGVLAAVEHYLKMDQSAELQKLEARVSHILGALKGVKGLEATRHVPEIANEVPHVALQWKESELSLRSGEVVRQLREGDPPIAVSRMGDGELRISVWMMQGDEHRVVARRLKEVFTAKPVTG